jgi:gas vesicle protein
MDNRFMRGLVMGGMIGAALTMMMPQVSPRTRRKMYRTGRRIASRAMDIMQDVRHMAR